jgi:hypothetical protein
MLKKILALALVVSYVHAGAQNYALVFNGSNQYVSIPNQASLALSANFTIEGWIYPTGVGSDATQGGIIINKENSYEIARFADGTLQYALSSTGSGGWAWVNTGLVAPLNTWTHIALVKSGTGVTLYFNGTAAFTNNSAPATMGSNTNALWLAGRSSVSQYFQGNMDEFRLWSTARTQSQLKVNMFNRALSNSAPGLVAYYRMNENAGTTTANSCTNTTGIDGTLANAPSWAASPIQFGDNAISFDGSDDYVNIPENSALDISSAITMEAWVYATGSNTIQDVISKSNHTTNTGYIFPRTDDAWTTVDCYLFIGGAWTTLAVPFPGKNAWHHLAMTYDGAMIKIYIDGTLAGSKAQTGAIATNTNALALGTQPGFPENFGGKADELRVWNVARTQAQVQASMNEIDPSIQTGLVAYYTSNFGIAAGTNTGLTALIDQSGSNNGTLTNFTLTGTSSNIVLQGSTIIPLPLSWLSFTAQQQERTVLLNWATAQEENTSDFLVQRSIDGNSWTTLGTVSAAGNSNAATQYNFTDMNPATGINQYRIEEQDLDGHINDSKIVRVDFSGVTARMIVYPNPLVTGDLNIILPRAAAVSLYNSTGALLRTWQLTEGVHQVSTGNLAKGVYLVKAGEDLARVIVL